MVQILKTRKRKFHCLDLPDSDARNLRLYGRFCALCMLGTVKNLPVSHPKWGRVAFYARTARGSKRRGEMQSGGKTVQRMKELT